ncbi:MAG: heme-binding protein [Gammaproteobacteria bacterium]|nr:heme-binding protein [Gammaproteobacteria bacterium]
MIRIYHLLAALGLALLLVAGCGGGGTSDARAADDRAQEGGGTTPVPEGTAGSNCAGSCADTPTILTADDVQRVIAQAATEAAAHNAPATIAVVDRVGNVLAVYRMAGAPRQVTITSTDVVGAPVSGGLEGVNIIPAELAAIAKAITGAYLSTEGNAFTTRTASQIVQENFNPGERNQPAGPLFGVQFSQLPCGDFMARFEPGVGPTQGPHRSPLGLAADAGGLPLYKRGTAVGGIGVIGDGTYSLDKLSPTTDGPEGFEFSLDEISALAGTFGFAPNPNRKADVITVVGKTLRYTDVAFTQLLSDPETAPSFDSLISSGAGSLRPVNGYYEGQAVLSGTPFGHPASGIRPAAPGEFVDAEGNDLDAFVFVDASNVNRFPPTDGTDAPGGDAANALTAAEVRQLLAEGLAIANRARAQIRRPTGTPARVTISIVDGNGEILGVARTRDGPVFGADVSLQKARTAAFFSGTGRVGDPAPAQALMTAPRPRYLAAIENPGRFAVNPGFDLVEALLDAIGAMPTPSIPEYLQALQTFTGEANLLTANGAPVAMSNRAVGNLHRPFYPDGVEGSPPGPLSKARNDWSIFSVGLQLDLVYNAIINHVAFVALPPVIDTGAGVVLNINDAPTTCVGNTGFNPGALFETPVPVTAIANGIQIFPGSVPIYRGDLLVGGFGVSGDGIDQDDMVAFLGTHNAGQALGTGIGNAPRAIRSDRIEPVGAPNQERLRYVNCPQAPFNDSSEDGVCERADGEVQ